MNGMIVRVHQIRQPVDVPRGFLCRKVPPHSCFQRTYQAFHDRSFGFIIRVVQFNVFVFQQRFKMFVEKFRALIRNDLFGLASTTQNGFEGIDERKTRFIFQRNHPGVFGKHIDAHQQVTVAIVKFLHGLHIGQIHLQLLVNTAHDHAVSFKTTTYGFVESLRILFHQPFFDFRTAYVEFSFFFHILIQTIGTAKPSRAFWIVIDACQIIIHVQRSSVK